ncbi:MAG TPA: NapC/NirT family cytochrome c [bacterium]|nr:NapC/NirT family cytochrome c [bacterium]
MAATILIVLAAVIVVLLVVLTRFLRTQAGGTARVFSVLAMGALPALWLMAMLVYADSEMKKVSFCTSCHEMYAHGNSLEVDDDESLVASHYRNNRVDRKKACYTCHTNPGFLGYLDAKMRGMHDVRVHYFGRAPEELELVEPYRNAVCLKCHGKAENFLEGDGHQYPETLIDDLRAEEVSCLECHDVGHILED